MLVLFQIFLMMALSSSLACSKLPGDKGQAGAALHSRRPSHPCLTEPPLNLSLEKRRLWQLPCWTLAMGGGRPRPWQPAGRVWHSLPQAVAPRVRGPVWKGVISCAPLFPHSCQTPHAGSVPRTPGGLPVLRLGSSWTPGLSLLPCGSRSPTVVLTPGGCSDTARPSLSEGQD